MNYSLAACCVPNTITFVDELEVEMRSLRCVRIRLRSKQLVSTKPYHPFNQHALTYANFGRISQT